MELHEMDLHDDDKPVGRVLSRREVMKLLGGAGAVLFSGTSFARLVFAQTATPAATATALPSCVVRPAQTEGPYFVEEDLNRFDIRFEPSDGSMKEGTPLHLKFRVSQIDADTCSPLENAQVDIWHCDALGSYSDVSDPGFSTEGQKWLRGYQVTDDYGIAEFMTIYPGWYSGRCVHIHFKIRTDPDSDAGYEFTSQLFFPETLTDVVHSDDPYASKGYRNTLNENDGIYSNGGDQLLLDPTAATAEELAAIYAATIARLDAYNAASGTATPAATATLVAMEEDGLGGYSATFDIGLDLSVEQSSDSFGGGVGSGGGPGAGGPPSGTRPAGGGPGGNPPPGAATATP